MKFNSFKLISLSVLVIFLSSCLSTTDTTVTLSSDASIVSLVFKANDSIPALSTAVFTLDADGITIVNLDSLPFETRIDSVYPTFSFTSSYVAYLYIGNDSVAITGTDTIDFSQPLKLRNYATDQKKYKDYVIKVNVHKVEPNLYVWSKVGENIVSPEGSTQKTIILNDILFSYVSGETTNYLYTSTTGYSWNTETSKLSGLPTNANLHGIVNFNNKLFFTQDGSTIITSSNGETWSTEDYTTEDYIFKSLLFPLKDSLLAITQSKTDLKYRFASSKDGKIWIVKSSNIIPAGFPVTDFSALAFTSRTGKAKAIVVGGKNADGDVLKSNWSTEDGNYWIDFSKESHSLDTLASGASIIAYDNKLLLFGVRNNSPSSVNHFKQSIDEGLTWQTPDSTYNYLPADFQARSFQSVVVDKSNRIFIVGGKNNTTILPEVWTGKVNKKSFIRQ